VPDRLRFAPPDYRHRCFQKRNQLKNCCTFKACGALVPLTPRAAYAASFVMFIVNFVVSARLILQVASNAWRWRCACFCCC
jgi:hypothetical protein